MAVGAVDVRLVGILPKLKVLAPWLLPNTALGLPEQGQKSGYLGWVEGKADNTQKHVRKGFKLEVTKNVCPYNRSAAVTNVFCCLTLSQNPNN
jgi:hypothetical protein